MLRWMHGRYNLLHLVPTVFSLVGNNIEVVVNSASEKF